MAGTGRRGTLLDCAVVQSAEAVLQAGFFRSLRLGSGKFFVQRSVSSKRRGKGEAAGLRNNLLRPLEKFGQASSRVSRVRPGSLAPHWRRGWWWLSAAGSGQSPRPGGVLTFGRPSHQETSNRGTLHETIELPSGQDATPHHFCGIPDAMVPERLPNMTDSNWQ